MIQYSWCGNSRLSMRCVFYDKEISSRFDGKIFVPAATYKFILTGKNPLSFEEGIELCMKSYYDLSNFSFLLGSHPIPSHPDAVMPRKKLIYMRKQSILPPPPTMAPLEYLEFEEMVRQAHPVDGHGNKELVTFAQMLSIFESWGITRGENHFGEELNTDWIVVLSKYNILENTQEQDELE